MRIDSFRRWSLFALVSVLAFPASGLAHPGHGLSEGGVAHWLTSPGHLLSLAAVGAGLFALGFLVKRQAQARGLQCAGAVLTLAAGFIWILGH